MRDIVRERAEKVLDIALLKARLSSKQCIIEKREQEVADLGARLDQARVWLQDIAAADWGDWCRPAYGLQDMAKEALAAIWKEE